MKTLYLHNTSENLTMENRIKKNTFNLSKQKKAEKIEVMSVQTESITKAINKQDPNKFITREYNTNFQSLPISYSKRL